MEEYGYPKSEKPPKSPLVYF